VLETHLGKNAIEMIDMLYQLVPPPQLRGPEAGHGDSE
jgi:hypothetical protein